MRNNAFNKRLTALEEKAKPRLIVTLADFVVWRAKWRRGIMEEVEIASPLKEIFCKGSVKQSRRR